MPFASKEDKKEYDKKWREQNRDKVNADARARYKKNREQELERKKSYYEIHKKEIAIKNKEWKDKYRDEINADARARYKKNREQELERKKSYYEIHKKEIAIKNKEWKDKYRDEINARERERYWRKKEEKTAILNNISKNKEQIFNSKSAKI